MLACAKSGNISMGSYVFEEDEIHLWHHGQDGSPVIVNTRKYMEYLTEDVDVNEMLKDLLLTC